MKRINLAALLHCFVNAFVFKSFRRWYSIRFEKLFAYFFDVYLQGRWEITCGQLFKKVRRFDSRRITIDCVTRANVLDKNAVSLATGAVFPQPSTATDGDLRRRACSAKGFPFPRELRCIFHGDRRSFVLDGKTRGFETGIYCEDVALFTISTERLTSTSSATEKVLAYQKWISAK